jgi:type IV fimbrial biogenesis protein FimT
MNSKTQRGFTLYELLVTILVMGVIFGLGVPNLLEFSRNNRMAAAANDIQSAIMAAREIAVTQRAGVTLCLAPEPMDDDPVCDPDFSDADSAGGYVVWVDTDADAVIDGGETIILQRDDPDDITFFADSGYIHFNPTGFVADLAAAGANSATRILYCDARGNVVVSGTLSGARAIRIPPTGRSVVINEVATITPVVDDLGAACP